MSRYARSGNGSAHPNDGAERRAQGLGWFSLGLGLTQVLAPGAVSRLIGARDDERTRTTMQAVGVREIASGIGILTQRQPAGWVWARVAGDLMDIALLGTTLVSDKGDQRQRTIGAAAAVLGVTVLDAVSAVQLSRGNGSAERALPAAQAERGVHVRRAITVNRSVEDVYRFWRDFTNLPRFMAHLESVQVQDNRSRWRAKAPAGTSVEWEAELVVDVPNERIAWQSLPGTFVPNHGSVRFVAAPGDRGTEVHVELRYEPPGGAIGAAIAKLFGENPEQQIKGDLRRFKQVLEAGEVVHSDASVHRGMHPARPSDKAASELKGISR
jgi:uncharacterized membrane protein